MINYLLKYWTGRKDLARIDAINDHLLYPSTPPLKSGTLYLDGEGTASAYVAQRGAELYLSGEFNRVVFAGSKKAKDWQTTVLSNRLKADLQSLPISGENEAFYIARIFAQAVGSDTFMKLIQSKAVHTIRGTNTGQKIRNARDLLLEDGSPIQAVTLAYGQRRVHGTMRQELGEVPVISVEGVYPLGFTKENWSQDPLAFATVMTEADKTGPRFDAKEPDFRAYFKDINVDVERTRISLEL